MNQEIYILTPDLNPPKTGGQVYNQQLYTKVKEVFPELVFITDKEFKPYKSAFLYNIAYIKLLFRKQPSFYLFDSRMYPRLFLVLSLFRLFFPKTKWVATHHHFNFLAHVNTKRGRVDRVLEMWTLRMCAEVIVPSSYTLKLVKELLPNKAISYIPLGFKRVQVKKSTVRNSKRLLYVGTICDRKGIHHFPKIMKALNDTTYSLNIVGAFKESDVYYQNVKQEVTNLGLENQIQFKGRLADKELEVLKQDSGMFVFPSHYEGFGMVIAEAFAYGLPVICFDTSAMPILVKHKHNGMLVPTYSEQKFADAIRYVATSESIYLEMRSNALNSFEQIPSIEMQLEQMNDWANSKKQTM